MKATLRLPRPATYANYLAVEQGSERRYELIDGVIVAMLDGSIEHKAMTNPSVIVEVLPRSSEGDHDGEKRRDFQSLAALQSYVLAAQDARCVKVYRRTERGEWRDVPDVYRDGESFELPGLTRAIAVDEVYDDILDDADRSLLR